LASQVQHALHWLSLQIQRATCQALLSDSLGIPGLYRIAPALRIRFHSHRKRIRKWAFLLQVNAELSPTKSAVGAILVAFSSFPLPPSTFSRAFEEIATSELIERLLHHPSLTFGGVH
jgi:hypothetical protein